LGDKIYTFGVSGDLYDSNLLMYDRNTKSEWLQITGQALEGPLRGTKLHSYPVAYDTWERWKSNHPDGKVLSIYNGYERRFGSYEISPYAGYDYVPDLFFVVNRDNKLLPRKTRVVGVEFHGVDKAYVEDALWQRGVIADRIGGDDVVIIADRATSRVGAFASSGHKFELKGGQVYDDSGRRWSWSGYELSLGDERLRSLDVIPTFWFAWAAIHPRTEVLGP
jgi:hypothetical protein